ncbi:MAG: 50S ribosomal protein L11 methyltransferase [Chloroflexi bacterium]|nr:MAG: 50S ribosomal protein L11 methyltransferase [Chloroflexota bacterium]
MAWLECSVEVEAEAVESVSELMASYGYNNGVAVDQPVIHGADGPDYRYDTERTVTVRTWIPVDHKSQDARAKLEQALWHLSLLRKVGSLKVTQLEEQLWAEAWKKHYTVQRIGKRSVIVPSWLEYAPQPNDIILKLDPGMAFGTGLHPTTRMCTQLLEEYMPPDTRVMDLGCGSGILAIVAAHLGAKEILAIDTDPIAVEATIANAAINGVAGLMKIFEGSLGKGNSLGHWLSWDAPDVPSGTAVNPDSLQCDVIAANLIAKVLVFLADDMYAALKPGGLLISSGIIADREDEVALAFTAAGLERLDRRSEGDWVALYHRRPLA